MIHSVFRTGRIAVVFTDFLDQLGHLTSAGAGHLQKLPSSSQVKEFLSKGFEPATLWLHLAGVSFAFSSDVLKKVLPKLTVTLLVGGLVLAIAILGCILAGILSEEMGAALTVAALLLASLSFIMLVLQHYFGGENGALAELSKTVGDLQEQLGIVDRKIDTVKDDTEALRAGLLPSPVRSDRLGYWRFPHAQGLYAAAFSADGDKIVTAGMDGSVTLWCIRDVTTTEVGQRVARGEEACIHATFSPDGKYIVAGWWDGTAEVWFASPPYRRYLPTLKHPKAVTTSTFSPDGRRVLTSCRDGTVNLWGIDGSLLKTIPVECRLDTMREDYDLFVINSASFSHSGKEIVSSCSDSGLVHVWDAATGNEVSRFIAHEGGTTSAVYSRDDTLIVTAGGNDCLARVWNTNNHELVKLLKGSRELRHEDTIWSAEFSPDGTKVVTASQDTKALVWDVTSGAIIKELPHGGPVITSCFSPCGRRILTACDDTHAYLWDVDF